MADKITDASKIITTQIQQKTDTGMVALRPETESDIVINKSTNISGSTIKDAFDNALPLTAGKNISINPKDTGIEIAFTGNLAPNVTVEGNAPITVTGSTTNTSASYTVKHDTNGFTNQYDSGDSTASNLSDGREWTIKIPKITVNTYGHVTAARDEQLTIKIPSVANMVTSSSTLTANTIILGNGTKTVKASSYGIIESSNISNPSNTSIPTSLWIDNRINSKITQGAQYLGMVDRVSQDDGSVTSTDNTPIIPNSPGDWVRVIGDITVYYATNGLSDDSSETREEDAHGGDILIYHGKNASNKYVWDVIHTEVDTDT